MKRYTIAAIVGLIALVIIFVAGRWTAPDRVVDLGVERAELRDAGLLVAEPRPDLQTEIDELAEENALLRQELERARAAAPSARPVAIVKGRTAPTPVAAPPLPGADPGCVPGECVLGVGDELRLEVDQVLLRTDRGSMIAVGTAAAIRSADGALLLRAPWSAELSRVVEAAPERRSDPGWGVGPWGLVSSPGWAIGLAVAPPPFSLLGLRLEPQLAAGGGPSGAAVAVSIIGRMQ